jgi:hypothetical protein
MNVCDLAIHCINEERLSGIAMSAKSAGPGAVLIGQTISPSIFAETLNGFSRY